ncbi:AAA family ATPase [Phycicoccus flavus]|uniref:AAA family ATPase n=1 Tax=Phycicoccus flavus TaxID=2502783 RepID=UPI000FEBFA34|nr:AAA family ATPase [Phycicoccus flavus]NHA69116.1 ATP-binding protein [Phycicoccus flavus]
MTGTPGGRLLCIGGPPGSGKTTAGRTVAAARRAALVDLDAVTTPLVEAVAGLLGVPPALGRPPLSDLRTARYACLAEVARDALAGGVDVVAVAPFTSEAADAGRWRRWASGLGASAVVLCWLDLPADAAATRASTRGLARDVVPGPAPGAARVDRDGLDLVVDAGGTPDDVRDALLRGWPRA